MVANVRSGIAWPLRVEVVEFRKHNIFLVPQSITPAAADGSTITMYPFVAVNLPIGKTFKEGQELLSNFLSSLSWVQGGGITIEHWSGGTRVRPVGESRINGLVTSQFQLEYLPEPTDQRARWALAFYREGLSLERSNVAYAVLSFFKILNIVAKVGPKQIEWINLNFPNFGIDNHRKFEVERRIAELKSSGVQDLGRYLYVSCRCAVAHAGVNPTVDPENMDDLKRLSEDVVLIRAMAAFIIERELHIKSRHTIWYEHLYELAGFKQIFGEELIARITTEVTVDETTVDLPAMNVAIRGKPPYGPLTNMNPIWVGYEKGLIHLALEACNKRGRIVFQLDFREERLHFNFPEDLIIIDDGTPEAAEAVAELKRFSKDYFGNGQLCIYNAETGALVSRKDDFIPMNMWLDFEKSELEIAHWRQVADDRRQRSKSINGEIIQWSEPYFLSIRVSFNYANVVQRAAYTPADEGPLAGRWLSGTTWHRPLHV